MSSDVPYEPPDPGAPSGPEASAFDLGPPPLGGPVPPDPPTLPPGLPEATATLLQSLATYERQEFERIVEGVVAGLEQRFDDGFRELHAPLGTFMRGVFVGAGAVVTALVLLTILGLLFLHGLAVVGGH